MRLAENVVLFPAGPFRMIGNLGSGYVIGLTDAGASLCQRMRSTDVAEDEIAAVDANLLSHLVAGSFVTAASGNAPATETTRGSAAYLHITPRCNLDCTGCYSRRPEEPSVDLPLADMLLLVERLADRDVRRLVISGGEPFLRSDLPEIVQHAKAVGMEHIDVLTNGTAIAPQALAGLCGFVDRVCVSFDGPSADAEALVRKEQRYAQLTDALRMIEQAGIPAHIIATIHARNMHDIPAYKALAEKLGATVSFSMLSAPTTDPAVGELVPDDDALAELARVLFGSMMLSTDPAGGPLGTTLSVCALCGAGERNLSVAADGRLYPCHMLHYDEMCMGSLLDAPEDPDGLASATAAPCDNPFAGLTVDDIPDCAACDIRYLCGGGCRARAFYATGDPAQRDPYCTLMREHYAILLEALSSMSQGKGV